MKRSKKQWTKHFSLLHLKLPLTVEIAEKGHEHVSRPLLGSRLFLSTSGMLQYYSQEEIDKACDMLKRADQLSQMGVDYVKEFREKEGRDSTIEEFQNAMFKPQGQGH
jgi:hypothetical protein